MRKCDKKYQNYGSFKKYIRVDFRYRCVYCHRHEGAFNSYREFQIDHIRPKSIPRFEHLENEYSNLVYSCPHCNNTKRAEWPSDNPVEDGRGWIDPCEYDFDDHYQIKFDGSNLVIKHTTPLGNWLIHSLGLKQAARIKNISKWYRETYKLRKLVLGFHRQSKREDILEEDRQACLAQRDDMLAILKDLFTPEPYESFKIPEAL
nr:HNH endonuclease signature motif containing protein [Deinococcus gobiensis]